MDLLNPLTNDITIAFSSTDNQNIELTFTDVNLAFDNVLRFIKLMDNKEADDNIKIYEGLAMLLGYDVVNELFEKLPSEIGNVYRALMDEVFTDLKDSQTYDLEGNPMPTPKEDKVYDTEQDAEFIYASFMYDYNIDLFEQQGKLDYRKYSALLKSLSEDTKLSRVIEIRQMKVPKGSSQSDREAIRKAKKHYELK